MSTMNRFARSATVVFLGTLITIPAAAQAEIEPDHFDHTPQQPAGVKAPARNIELESQIAAQQKVLDECYVQISSKLQLVEKARKAAEGSAAMENSAYIFIDAYKQERREFEELKSSLAPRISQALDTINTLQKELTQTAKASSPGEKRHRRPALPVAARSRQSGVIAASSPGPR